MAWICGARSRLDNFSSAGDCLATLAAVEQMGLVCRAEGGRVEVSGLKGSQGAYLIDAANSGTTARLIMGLAAFQEPGAAITIQGDAMLSRRPMERVARSLRPMGINTSYLERSGFLPLRVERAGTIRGISQVIEVPSAQVKSAVLLAGLSALGVTEVVQRPQTRNHTELMLKALGADINWDGASVRLTGGGTLSFPLEWPIPGDFSCAAWWAAMAAVDGEVTLKGVGVNPTRTGFAEILRGMGAHIEQSGISTYNGEEAADVTVRAGDLTGVGVPPELIPACIDELPALAAVAAFARGRTVVRGAEELKFKESDRLAEIAKVLSAFGADYELLPDGFAVRGRKRLHAARVESRDHRIVMAALIMGALSPGASEIGDVRWLGISYPEFLRDLKTLTGLE